MDAKLIRRIKACQHCAAEMQFEPRPVIQIGSNASILIIGQAPGKKVFDTRIPFNDASGDRLRNWMGIEQPQFYDPDKVAIVPMAFCYPGRGRSGDLAPSKHCAPKWHKDVLNALPNVRLTLLIGQYAHAYYLDDERKTLADRVLYWKDEDSNIIPMVHPSPRNNIWLAKNPWFEREIVPLLRKKVELALRS